MSFLIPEMKKVGDAVRAHFQKVWKSALLDEGYDGFVASLANSRFILLLHILHGLAYTQAKNNTLLLFF